MACRWIRSSSRLCPSFYLPPPPPPPFHHPQHYRKKEQTPHYNEEKTTKAPHVSLSSSEIVGSLLNLCRKSHTHDLSMTRLIYTHITRHGVHLDMFTCESILLSLAKCGAIEDALYLLHRCLQQTSVFAWTAIISSYVDLGKPVEALEIFHYMINRDGIEPDRYTFVALLKACGNIPYLNEGRNLHMYVEKKGCASDSFVACSLVTMYGRCRSIDEAEKVFVEMYHHDVASWSAMVSAYLDEGQGAQAIRLYRQVCAEDRGACKRLLILAIKACGCLAEEASSKVCLHGEDVSEEMRSACSHTKAMAILNIGRALHSQALMDSNLVSHHSVLLLSALVSMYGKCGAISHAENAFVQLPQHDDLITWNSMLSAYVEHGLANKALWLYQKMHDEGTLIVSKQTIMIALRACQHLPTQMEPDQILELVNAFYDVTVKKGIVSDVDIGGAFVSLLGKCGRIDDAERIFSGLSAHDIPSWTKMMSAYIENGHPDKALQIFARIERSDMSLDQHTIAVTIQACIMTLDLGDSTFLRKDIMLEIGRALHTKARKRHLVSNVFISSNLITMYGKCGHIIEAENLFFAVSTTHNVVLWTAMLSVYLEQGQECTVLRFYYEMQKQAISPDEHAFMVVIQACAKIGEGEVVVVVGQPNKLIALQIGKGLHADADKMGFASDILVASTLLNMYGKCSDLTEAEMLFNTMSQQNDVMAFTAMISLYVEHGRGNKAMQLYAERSKNIYLDDVIAICSLKACSLTGSLEVCRQIHSDIVSTGLCQSKSLINTILRAYGCCASMADAMVAMDGLPQPDIVSWNSCIGPDGDNTMTSLLMFESMLLAGVEPEKITFLSVLSSLSHLGLVEKGIECFKLLPKKYGLIPNQKHYFAFVDLLGRAGNLDRLKDIINSHIMTNSDVFGWIQLLSACDRHGDVELGECIFDHVMNLQPDETAAYVLMSNIYAYRIE